MTLCIAAACQEKGKARIVIATDWKAGTDIASAENEDKLDWVDDNVAVMIAGTLSRATELTNCYKQYFRSLSLLSPGLINAVNFGDHLREPIRMYTVKRANELVVNKSGLTYNEFLEASGKQQLPEDMVRETLKEISQMDFGCELVITTFLERNAYIFKVSNGDVEPCFNFAAIGTGSLVAEATLYQRMHDSDHALGPTVYRVYEAMRLGSVSPTVGDDSTIHVLYPPIKNETVFSQMADLKEKTEKFLERQFKRLGPKAFERLSLPPDPFE